MARILTSLLLVALLVTGARATVQLLASAPAFNAELREVNVFGDDTLQTASEMYELPAYLFQIANSYVRADLVASADTETSEEFAPVDTAADRAAYAVDLLERSVAGDPANAHVWATLAWAHSMTADYEAAREALAVSWQLAPRNRQLAESRMALALTLFDTSIPEIAIEPTAAERAGSARDLETLEQHDREFYELYTEEAAEAAS